MRLLGMMLVRNEQGRYLERVLEQMRSVCDKIVVNDDASTDRTPEICEEYGAIVSRNTGPSLWGTDELSLRKVVWAMARTHAKPGDWLLCLDAD